MHPLARPAAAQVEKTSIDLSSEQLDQADGDYLFYGVQGGDESKLTGEALWSTPRLLPRSTRTAWMLTCSS